MNEHGTLTAPGTVRFERLLPGPIERVWAYLTESEKRRTWFAAGEVELTVGGRIEHIFDHATLSDHEDPPPEKYAHVVPGTRIEGRVTACEPPRLLAFTMDAPFGGETEVTFELSPHEDGVLLVLTHRRLEARDLAPASGGWHTHLDILRDRLTGAAPAPFWLTHTRLEEEYAARFPADRDAG